MNLLDIPMFRVFATWIWADDPDPTVSPEACLGGSGIPLIHMPGACWGRLVAKGLGIAIILGACISKAPMIWNMMESKSSKGLSKQGLYAEVVLIANMTAYGMLEGHPFTSYGEVVALLVQSILIVLLLWQYSEGDTYVTTSERSMVGLICVAYVLLLSLLWPHEWNFLLLASSWPIMLYSRTTQLWESYCEKHTGAQSGITIGLNTIGTAIRLFTTWKEVGLEWALLLNFGLAFFTNVALLSQYFYYQRNTQQFLQSLKEEQQRDKIKKE
ncbi:hypothetical protein ACA910_020630 [Epithemia clementina (nom. ined.)]